MKDKIIVTKEMTEALKLQDLHAKVLKEEEEPKIVTELKKIGFKFGTKKGITIKPEDQSGI